MTLWAAGTSLISATAPRNQLYLPYSNTLNVFSSPFPEFGTWTELVHGQNKPEFVAIISLNFFCKVTRTSAGPLPTSCSLGSCLCLQKQMPISPWHDGNPHQSCSHPTELPVCQKRHLPHQNPHCKTCPSFIVHGNHSRMISGALLKFWVWQAMTHTFLWNAPKRELGHTSLRTSTHLPGPTDWGSSAILPLFKYGPEKQRWLM